MSLPVNWLGLSLPPTFDKFAADMSAAGQTATVGGMGDATAVLVDGTLYKAEFHAEWRCSGTRLEIFEVFDPSPAMIAAMGEFREIQRHLRGLARQFAVSNRSSTGGLVNRYPKEFARLESTSRAMHQVIAAAEAHDTAPLMYAVHWLGATDQTTEQWTGALCSAFGPCIDVESWVMWLAHDDLNGPR